MKNKLKVRCYSDLHLDHYAQYASSKGDKAFWYPPVLEDDKNTILILAGDLWMGSKWIEWAGFSWISKVAPRFKQVLVVLGNHCYWPMGDLTITHGANKCNALLSDMKLENVIVLDCDTFAIDDVLFVGATLWTDMDKHSPFAMYNMKNCMAYDGKCRYETGPIGQYQSFNSDLWVRTHTKHKLYIKHVVEQNRDKKIVVITHHVPLTTLGDPMYEADSSNCYYSSDLSEFILDNPHIVAWVNGHSHYCRNELFGDNTRMINRSLGYMDENKERKGTIPHDIFEF